jgi:hypothetical protein
MDQSTIQQYKQKFEKLQETVPFRITTEPKAWYRQKFKFKLIFRKKEFNERSRSFFYAASRWKDTAHIYEWVRQVDPTARTRHEFGLSVFTNSTKILDVILQDKPFQEYLVQVTHMDLQYANEFANLDNVAMDVKLVGPRSRNRNYKYMVQFTWFFGRDNSTLAAYASTRESRYKKIKQLYDFCMDNSDSLVIDKNVERYAKYGKKEDYFYGAPKVWCHNADQIPLMYMMFGEIEKIYKIVEKEKNNEQ